MMPVFGGDCTKLAFSSIVIERSRFFGGVEEVGVLTTQILGTGIGMPATALESTAWDHEYGKPEGWLEGACGVAVRKVAKGTGETQEMLAVAAAREALVDADMAAESLDLILFCAAVGRQPIPSTAPLIKGLLGIEARSVAAYDVNATCLGALVAMDVADMHIRTGRAQRVLVVSSEIASRGLPWADDPATAGLFGDGAGAIVLVLPLMLCQRAD